VTTIRGDTDQAEWQGACEEISAAPEGIAEVGRCLARGLTIPELARELGLTQEGARRRRAVARRWLRYRLAGLGPPGPLPEVLTRATGAGARTAADPERAPVA